VSVQQYASISKEIELCSRLYPQIEAAMPLLKAIYKAKDRDVPNPHWVGEFYAQVTSVSNCISDVRPELREDLEKLAEYLHRRDIEQAGNILELINSVIVQTSLSADLVTFILTVSIGSLQQNGKLRDVFANDSTEHKHCPTCGLPPHYGTIKEDGTRHLECWLCGTTWVHPRLKCPYCFITEQEDQGYFTTKETGCCKVHFCKSCNKYYKIFDTRLVGKPDIIAFIHNLATLSLDTLAVKEGFHPGSGLRWVSESEIAMLERGTPDESYKTSVPQD